MFCASICYVEAQNTFHDTKLGNTVNRFRQFWDEYLVNGLDSSYIRLPQKPFIFSVNTYLAGVQMKITCPQVPIPLQSGEIYHTNVIGKLSSGLNNQVSISISYRGTGLSYAWDIKNNNNRDLSFRYYDNAYGGELRYHSTRRMEGSIDCPELKQSLDIDEGMTKVSSFIVNIYGALNYKRFSYPAALAQYLIQRHSAGSIVGGLGYFQSKIQAYDEQLNYIFEGVEKITVRQATLGLGYAYNLSLFDEKMLIHGSFVPMILLMNKNYVSTLSEANKYKDEIIDKHFGGNNKISFTAVGRLSICYNIHNYLLGINGLYNRFKHKTSNKYSVLTRDWIVQIYAGIRF